MSNKKYVTLDLTNHKIINLATPTDNYDAVTLKYVVDTLGVHTGQVTGAHTASAISFVPTGNTSATNVQNAIVELQSEIDNLSLFDQSLNKSDNVQFNDLLLTGNLTVHGTLTTISSTEINIGDKNIVLGDTTSQSPSITPTDILSDGGGLTLKGDTDKTWNWVNSTDSWTSNQNIDIISSGTSYKISGTSVLSSDTLGSGVIYSSLTSLGTISTGVWHGTIIDPTYGGTGINNGVNTLTIGLNASVSGSNTGDQNLSGLMVKSNNLSDVTVRQTALNNLTAVSAATNEYVLTKDTSTGNAIFKVLDGSKWEDVQSNTIKYGRLYNWNAVNTGKLAPIGWHVPTDSDITILSTFLGGDNSGGSLKEIGTTHWNSPNTGATNSSGFTAIPGGYRYRNGTFYELGVTFNFWSSTENTPNSPWSRTLFSSNTLIQKYYSESNRGMSVRCIKDDNIAPTSPNIIDIDGNIYTWVYIGTQYWLVQNLATTKYNDGTLIPKVTSNTTWLNLSSDAYCDYNNDVSNSITTTSTNYIQPKLGKHIKTDVVDDTLDKRFVTDAQLAIFGALGSNAFTSTTYQPLATNLTSLSGLTYVSESFVKMTGANTFTLDTNIYLTSLSGAVLTGDVSNSIVTDQSSTTKVPSVKSIKDYADGLVIGLLDDRGSWDASGNTYPATGGSGVAGVILKGDLWFISVGGTLNGQTVTIGTSIRALVDTPGQTNSNWNIITTTLGFTPENVSNKETGTLTNSSTKYPASSLMYSELGGKQSTLNGTGFVKISGTTISYDNSVYLTSLSGAVLTDQTVGQTIGVTGARLTKLWATDITVTNSIAGSVTGNAGTVTNATFTTALTVNTGTLTLIGNSANTSVLTIGAGASSISGSNTGDNAANSSTAYIGTTSFALNRTSSPLALTGISSIGIRDTSASFDVTVGMTSSTTLNSARSLTIDVVNTSPTLKIGANLTVTGTASIQGTNTGDQTISDATISTTDITTNNVTTSKHGFFPKLPTPTGLYLRDDLTWGTPGSGAAFLTQTFTSQTSVTVTHNLGTYPIVQVVDDTNALMIPLSVIYGSLNAFTVNFSPAKTGTIIYTIGGVSVISGGSGGSSKMKVQLLPTDANLTGSIYEPLLVGIVGTNTNWDELRFDDTTSQNARYTISLAQTTGYGAGAITCKIEWKATAITGSVAWQLKMLSRTTGEQIDTAYDITNSHTAVTAVNGTTGLLNTSTIQFTPIAGELTAGKDCFIQLTRLTADGNDTMAGDAKVITLNITED